MPLKTKKVTYIEVDYHDLEQLIQETYQQPDYNIVADEEWSNDSRYTFTLERAALNEYQACDVGGFRADGNGQYKLGSLLADLCLQGHIEPGDYLVATPRVRGKGGEMERKDETKLLASLTEALDAWLDGPAADASALPYFGNNLCELMARGAMAVLLGQADVYDRLLRNGELRSE